MARAAGIQLDIEGIDEMLNGLKKGRKQLRAVMRDILRGPFGESILAEVRARVGDYQRTGYTLERVKIIDDKREGVEVGISSKDKAKHPSSKRANAYSIGVWLESGTRMHLIPTKVSPFNKLAFGGRVVSRVAHPGTPRRNIMRNSLKAYRSDFEREVVRELERRLGRQMGMR